MQLKTLNIFEFLHCFHSSWIQTIRTLDLLLFFIHLLEFRHHLLWTDFNSNWFYPSFTIHSKCFIFLLHLLCWYQMMILNNVVTILASRFYYLNHRHFQFELWTPSSHFYFLPVEEIIFFDYFGHLPTIFTID